jgi:aldose sugar dehydrogenase
MCLSRMTLASPFVLMSALPALAETRVVETEALPLNVETVAEGLTHPWAIAFISDEVFLVTERDTGTLRAGTVGGEISEPIWEAEDLFRYQGPTHRSQAGLFDIQLHPDFEQNGWVYISYSRETERGAAVVVVRGTVTPEEGGASITGVEDVFVMKEENQDSSGLHFGGRMAFDLEDDALYLSIGERRNLERAQDPADQAGAVLRMTDEGEPHPDNPTFAAEEEDEETDPYLFAMGIRNIQALGVHPFTNELWAADHGPEGGDEINLIAAGNNYGWPFLTGGVDYSGAPIGVGLAMEGMISPVHVFEETVAPSGLMFVPDGSEFTEWVGDMLIGGLMTEGVVRVTLEGGEVVGEEAIELGHRIRDVRLGPDGALWLVSDEENGRVLRLSPGG